MAVMMTELTQQDVDYREFTQAREAELLAAARAARRAERHAF